jgi:hypothetical protein
MDTYDLLCVIISERVITGSHSDRCQGDASDGFMGIREQYECLSYSYLTLLKPRLDTKMKRSCYTFLHIIYQIFFSVDCDFAEQTIKVPWLGSTCGRLI